MELASFLGTERMFEKRTYVTNAGHVLLLRAVFDSQAAHVPPTDVVTSRNEDVGLPDFAIT